MAPDPDLLESADWECTATAPGEACGPCDLESLPLRWIPATVPGTAAGAIRDAGMPERSSAELDGEDWWFRCGFPAPVAEGVAAGRADGAVPPDAWLLELAGLATIADVWLNGVHLVHSEEMFTTRRARITGLRPANELTIRFSALEPVLSARRPRPRWKTAGASNQNLRWFRTTLLGRQPGWAVTPAPVGPWRPVHLFRWSSCRVVERRLVPRCRLGEGGGTSGTLSVDLLCTAPGPNPEGAGADRVGVEEARLEVGGTSAALTVEPIGGHLRVRGSAVLDAVDRWWPHTHGRQPLYPVTAVVGGTRLELGSVGFREVEVDDADGRFEVVVNGAPVFCRGASWYPIDPVAFTESEEELRDTLTLVRDAGMNMIRVPGGTVYPDDRFFSLCDQLGIMVWQDAMLAFLDPPDDDRFTQLVTEELTEVLSGVAAHPSLSVICGGQELEEQPAMFGLSRSKWQSPLTATVIPALADRLAPGVPYLTSSPSGGALPFQVDHGVSHYTGVGVFMRPLTDLRRAAPRFVSEGLAFSVPPESETVADRCGGARQAGHDPSWKRAIHHDTGGSWDLEDVRDHYVRVLFGEDPALLRRHDPERALDLGRAAVAHVMAEAMAEWRRPGSPCAGLLLVGLRDLRLGAGWGVVDALGRPKAPWFTLARASRPIAVLVTDEGLNGLGIHLVNDTGTAVAGVLDVELYSADHRVEEAMATVEIPARGGVELAAYSLFDGFRDLTYAYRFGPRSYELVMVRLRAGDGTVLAETSFLPGGPARTRLPEIGLQTSLRPVDDQAWSLFISTRSFAQFVCVDVPGFRSEDSWFHLEPGGSLVTVLHSERSGGPAPRGQVRALNAVLAASVSP
jgi:beta-mannosidase